MEKQREYEQLTTLKSQNTNLKGQLESLVSTFHLTAVPGWMGVGWLAGGSLLVYQFASLRSQWGS